MYETIKKLAISVVPRKFLFENELAFRSIFAFHLSGKNHKCTVCNRGLKKFIEIADGDLLCPFCGSRSRTRRLYKTLTDTDLIHGKVLHFSPSRSIYRLLKTNSNITYFSSDYEDKFIAEYQYDITDIPLENNFFDLIICYHILEHIEKDTKAMQELHRVLKPGGICIIQTPFKDGDIYEDYSIKTPEERLKAFGQEDHVRIYSVQGLQERLKTNGFDTIETHTLSAKEESGFKEENILIVKK